MSATLSPRFLASTRIPGVDFSAAGRPGLVVPAGPGSLVERVAGLDAASRSEVRALIACLSDPVRADDLRRLREACPRIALVANYAVGYNNIDVAEAARLGIRVTNTPGVLAPATADIALALLLITSRRLAEGMTAMQGGSFPGWSPEYLLGTSVAGKVVGIVGLGEIGTLFAHRTQALGMRVVALESLRGGARTDSEFPRLREDEFLATADVISLHCPLTPETRDWLNRERLGRMKRGAILINTARGEMIDEEALADALESGHLFAAGLDVFRGEPVMSAALRRARNLVVLPHLGSATVETREAMGRLVQESIRALDSVAAGQKLPRQVN